MLDVSLIRLDGGTQTRAEQNPNVVQEYAADMLTGVQFPPITVFFDGSDYWLADGFHRVAAAIAAGLREVAADVRQGTRRDAVLFSVGANATHGLRRTNADKRRAVETLLRDEEWGKWSDREIARRCGVHHTTVANAREELSLAKLASDERTYTTKHGTVATMNTANIGQRDVLNGRSLSEMALEHANDRVASGETCTPEEWEAMPDEYLGRCYKQCYAPRVMYKGSVYEYGAYGVYVCSGCGYAYPPGCEPEETVLQENNNDEWDTDTSDEVTAPSVPANYSSESNEWYTPARYINASRAVMGGFDTDPASNDQAQGVIQAATYYTIDDDGFHKPWHGRVWLNPPYGTEQGKSRAGLWGARLIEQYRAGITTEAILLVNATPERKWFQPFWDFPVCLTNHRIKYEVPDGATSDDPDQPVYGSAFVYLGANVARFVEVFSQFGPVLCRMTAYDGQVYTLLDEVAA